MQNLFAHASSYWVRYNQYEIKPERMADDISWPRLRQNRKFTIL